MVKGEVIRHIRNTDNTSLYQVFSGGCLLRIMCAVGDPFSVLFNHWGVQFSVSCLQWGGGVTFSVLCIHWGVQFSVSCLQLEIPSLYCLFIGGFNSLYHIYSGGTFFVPCV